MPITYTNRKGVTYYLCRGVTKTSKPRYYFAREPKSEPVEQIPEGFKISESVNGIVSLVRDRPALIQPEEARYLETIKANVLLQLENLRTYDCVREAISAGQLTLHGWLYDLHSGDLLAYDDESGQWSALALPVDDQDAQLETGQ